MVFYHLEKLSFYICLDRLVPWWVEPQYVVSVALFLQSGLLLWSWLFIFQDMVISTVVECLLVIILRLVEFSGRA